MVLYILCKVRRHTLSVRLHSRACDDGHTANDECGMTKYAVYSTVPRSALSLNLMQMNLNSSASLGHKAQIKLSEEKWTVHI